MAYTRYSRRDNKGRVLNKRETQCKDFKYRYQYTREGIETARISGKQIGGITGRKFTIKPQDIPNSECPAAVNIGI